MESVVSSLGDAVNLKLFFFFSLLFFFKLISIAEFIHHNAEFVGLVLVCIKAEFSFTRFSFSNW